MEKENLNVNKVIFELVDGIVEGNLIYNYHNAKDNLKSTMNIMGQKIEDAADMFEPKKLAHDIKKQMK